MRLGIVLLAAAGCLDSGPVGTINSCPQGNCTVSDSLQLAVEVVPVSTSTNTWALPSQEIGALSIDTKNGAFTLLLEAPVMLSGTVKTLAARPDPVSGTLVATRPSRILGRPDVYYQTKIDAKGNWSLVVSPTHDTEIYTLHVLPDDTAGHPPESFLVSATSDNAALDLALSDPLTLLQIHGTVGDAVQKPISGMQVQAIDPVTRVTLSTTATTDAQGNFVVKVAPPARMLGAEAPLAQSVLLQATPPKDANLPLMETTVDTSKLNPANSLTMNLTIPALPAPTQLIYKVTGVGPNGIEASVVGAHCQFSADVSDPKSGVTTTYTVAADTDAEGKATVVLVPAADGTRDYSVAVTPPATSDFQAVLTTVGVGPSGGYGASIKLAQRAQVTGRVLGPNAQPVKTLTVGPNPATLADALRPSTNVLAPKLSTTLTDGEGRFVLHVDAGTYDLSLVPNATTPLPRQWVDRTQITTDVTLPDISLPEGAMVNGQVIDSTGAPIVGARVALYSLASANAACPAQDYTCLAPPRLAAEGTTGRDGSVAVLLPASR